MGPACRRRDQGQLPGVPPREGRKGGAVECTTVPRAAEDVARDLKDLLKVFDGLLAGEYERLEGALRVYGPVEDWNARSARSSSAGICTAPPRSSPRRSRRSRPSGAPPSSATSGSRRPSGESAPSSPGCAPGRGAVRAG
jgi:hypothetical protein